MKNKIKRMPMIVLAIVLVTVVFTYLNANNSYEEKIINKPNKVTKKIALNLEQTEGSGDYKLVTQSNWPSEGYKFNSELSKCENDGELSWDDTKKIVVFSGNVSDKCYVYFDKVSILALVDYIISQYTGTQGDNGIYYHNSSLENGAGDNSYRYAGANPNNFVCFGSTTSPCPTDNLYRIIGVIDGKVKLIKYDYANSNLLGTDGDYYGSRTPDASYYKGKLTSVNTYYWYESNTNTWSASNLNKTNLNTNFINNIGATWANKIETTTWKVGGNTSANIRDAVPSVAYKNEITTPAENTTYDAKIGLMYTSDYGFAASPSAWTTKLNSYNSSSVTSVNWMYMGVNEWTISHRSDNSDRVFYVSADGYVSYSTASSHTVVRPSFNLTSSTSYVSGSGSMTDPIRLS